MPLRLNAGRQEFSCRENWWTLYCKGVDAMKKQAKKLSLNEASRRMAKITQDYLDRLPPAERERKLKAFQALAVEASARLQRGTAEIHATPGTNRRVLVSPVAARGGR